MSKQAMREEAERLIRETMEKKALVVKQGNTRIEAVCGKCGAPNRVQAEQGASAPLPTLRATTPSRTSQTPPHNPDASATARDDFPQYRRRPTARAVRRAAWTRHCPGTGCRN